MTTEELANLRNELRTQGNRATGCPLFIVEVEKRIYGMDPDIDDLDFIWVYTEDSEYTYEPGEIFDEIRMDQENNPGTKNLPDDEIAPEDFGYHQLFYVTHMEFVCAHLTEKAAEQYIKANSHNLRKPRSYVTSQYRCHEWNMVREHLMADTSDEVHQLKLEIEILRRYGNKDCTAMADEALEAVRKS